MSSLLILLKKFKNNKNAALINLLDNLLYYYINNYYSVAPCWIRISAQDEALLLFAFLRGVSLLEKNEKSTK